MTRFQMDRKEHLDEHEMVPEDIVTLLPTIKSGKRNDKMKKVAMAYWVDNKVPKDIAKELGVSRGYVYELAHRYLRFCMHPSRRAQFKSKQGTTTNE